MRFTVGDNTSMWQRIEVGIVTGCTSSVILFEAAMNLVIKLVEKNEQRTNHDLQEVISWARVRFKPSKSRSTVL